MSMRNILIVDHAPDYIADLRNLCRKTGQLQASVIAYTFCITNVKRRLKDWRGKGKVCHALVIDIMQSGSEVIQTIEDLEALGLIKRDQVVLTSRCQNNGLACCLRHWGVAALLCPNDMKMLIRYLEYVVHGGKPPGIQEALWILKPGSSG